MKRLLLIALATLALSGCGESPPGERLEPTSISGGSLSRYVDSEAGVVCYSTGSGLDCLPISETRLEGEK